MTEPVTNPETVAERLLREIAEGVERFIAATAEIADEAAATARLATNTEARIRALPDQQDA